MSTLFSSGLELAECMVASDLLRCSWETINDLHKKPRSSNAPAPLSPFSVTYETYQQPKYEILAFACPSSSSSAGQQQQQQIRANPYLSINITARALYRSLPDGLFVQLEKSSRPLIVTGNSLGGLVASLVTLEILQRFSSSKTNDLPLPLPLCITFGSPIVSSNGLRQAIYDRPIWNSQFLHVVSVQDQIPLLLIPSNSPSVSDPSTSHSKGYNKPFGTYLMCSTSGCVCLNKPDSVTQLLEAKGRSQLDNPSVDYGNILGHLEEFNTSRLEEYGNILEGLKKSINLSNGFSSRVPGLSDLSLLEVGRRMQLEETEVTKFQEYYNLHGILMADIEKQEREDSEMELNKAKINMAKLEWFKKDSWTTVGSGYYDCYKSIPSESGEVIKWKKSLTEYWKKVVEEATQKPQQKGGVPLQLRYLRAGTNYRRMVEPLDIADFYKIPGQKKYLKHRPKHYKLLQKWQEDDDEKAAAAEAAAAKNQKKLSIRNKAEGWLKLCILGLVGHTILFTPDKKNEMKYLSMRNKAVTLTEDSCFWAHVEDAMISIQLLKNGKEADCEPEESLDVKEFESYVMGLIENLKVSPEIFLQESSFMCWWREYYKTPIKDGNSSPLIDYMKAEKYVEYA
ncbi:senescence-associated carboxylesterase 101-like [Macadamia integrifolia]|uniref:senescence-associated carboxylesterase 101-like n=1 Tax=Macadamia integrifolia TaxID=60698 RepID=UPI001C4EB56D|nr:senescence-associated carboxylesterase 101-like [Macadamia integrifolia]